MARKASGGGGGKRRGWRRALYWGVVLGLWLGVGLFAVVAYYALGLPDVSSLGQDRRAPSLTVLDRKGAVIARYGHIYGDKLRRAEIPQDLVDALLATEDRRFYEHGALDMWGLGRAMLANLRAGHVVQGGSTLSQQLAKNLFLSADRTAKRKIREGLLALWLEHKFTKDEILTLYLNRVYLGAGTYGVDAAARRYFGHSARRLTLAESAIIAGLLKAPSRYAPSVNKERSWARARQVLVNMVEAGYLTPDEAARATPPRLARKVARIAPRYFADWVAGRLADYVGQPEQDLEIYTTLDAGMQRQAEQAVTQALARDGGRLGAGQAALVAMAPDGAVRAMVGGRSYAQSQFNRATQARRQPGSAFKLFVYLAGLEAGLTPR